MQGSSEHTNGVLDQAEMVYPAFSRVADIRRYCEATPGTEHWFSAGAMGFFNSRVHDPVYGGRFFVTSERAPGEQRRYTVRLVQVQPAAGAESTYARIVSTGFQRHTTPGAAHRAAERCALAVESGHITCDELATDA